MTLLPRLAQRTGATVLFAFAARRGQGDGFDVHLLPAPAGLDHPDPERAAAALNAGVEACARQVPAQYQWTYKRFGRQPGGAASPYRAARAVGWSRSPAPGRPLHQAHRVPP